MNIDMLSFLKVIQGSDTICIRLRKLVLDLKKMVKTWLF